MIKYKTEKEIEIMKEGGSILKKALGIVLKNIKVGISLHELDTITEREIIKNGAFPSFKKVKGYHWTLCCCINDMVVHGIPTNYQIADGDIVGIDCGVYYRGFHTDAAWTVKVGSSKKDNLFLTTGKQALDEAIAEVKVGNYIYDISSAIQRRIRSANYQVVETLVGHGIGKKLHEDPEIPGFVNRKREDTPLITKGMALAIEVIYNLGTKEVEYRGDDKWTIVTKDGKISGLFEATVALTNHGCLVLT